MGKLLRRSNKSPDAEQLLTPRKQGFFGKRNNGVRSEDTPTKPKTARGLVASVFKSSKKVTEEQDEDDIQRIMPTLDKPPATPKTAPPSPDLVGTVLARSNSQFSNHHLRTSNNNNAHNHNPASDDSLMSDLTGTVGPVQKDFSQVAEEKASGITPPVVSQGVTFAESTPHRSESFYSAYSPALDVFRTDSGNVVNVGSDMPSGHFHFQEYPTSPLRSEATDNRYCKPFLLDQVLGVVDGACQRSMDLTLGSQWKRSDTATSGLTREWGTAPSADDDESTFLDTRADSTFYTRETSTFRGTTPTGTSLCTGTTSLYGTTLQDSVMTPHSAPTMETSPLGDSCSLKLDTTMSLQDQHPKDPPTELKRERTEDVQHENFELVLGQTGLLFGGSSEEDNAAAAAATTTAPKKRGWTTKIMQKGESKKKMEEEKKEEVMEVTQVKTDKPKASPVAQAPPAKAKTPPTAAQANTPPAKTPPGVKTASPPASKQADPSATSPQNKQTAAQPAQFSPSAKAAQASNSAPNSPIPTKQEQREALFQSVFGDDFTKQDIGVEVQPKKFMKQQEEERLVAGKPPPSPSPKKGLSGLVKRLRFGKVRRTKSTSSVPPKKALGVFGNAKAAVTKSATTPQTTAKKAVAPPARPSSPPPRPPPVAPPPVAAKPRRASSPALAAYSPAPVSARARSPSPRPISPPPMEEEKEEIDDPLDTTLITDNTSTGPEPVENVPPAYSTPVKEDATPRKSSRTPSPQPQAEPVKPIRSDIKTLPDEPGPVTGRSSSFRLPLGRFSKTEPAEPKSSKTSGADPSESTDVEEELEKPVGMFRLRSAPIKSSSAELSEEQARGKAKEEIARKKPPRLTWKAATDAQGRTYYYHRESRKTQWVKPPEFDDEVVAVKKYKEEMEALKKEAEAEAEAEAETQQVVEGYKNVEAIRAELRKKTQRDFDPEVWQTKQEILDIVQTMPLPKGTNIEKLLVQYDGREQQLLANLRDLVESKPFDEPFQTPATAKKAAAPTRQRSATTLASDSNLNISHASSSVSSSALQGRVDVQHRIRTAASASTRISEKTNLTEKTEKIRNTGPKTGLDVIGTITEGAGVDAMSTGSISSASRHSMPPRSEHVNASFGSGRIPSKIPAVPRSRDLKVEEFTNNRIAKETFNGECIVPPSAQSRDEVDPIVSAASDLNGSASERPPSRGPSGDMGHGGAKAVAQQIVGVLSLDDDDDDSYNGDYEETVDTRGDNESEKVTDSISALSEADVDYQAQKENFERARRRALDVAVEREDWDLAAALSEGMKQVKESLYGKPTPQREWTQTELDRFISENDWDAVSKYIAHMRDHSIAGQSSIASGSAMSPVRDLSHLSEQRGRDPETGRDPEGFSLPKRMPPPGPMDEGPPHYVSEASKRAAAHTLSSRRQHQHQNRQQVHNTSVASQDSGRQRAQTRFGARSQLQHSDLTSISSWGDSSSSYDSEYTDNSYEESEEEHGYISLRVRRNEFQC